MKRITTNIALLRGIVAGQMSMEYYASFRIIQSNVWLIERQINNHVRINRVAWSQ